MKIRKKIFIMLTALAMVFGLLVPAGTFAQGGSQSENMDSAVSTGYSVEFTYNDRQYVLQGGERVELADILSAIGLTGEPTGVQVSNPALFSASNETGAWAITSHAPFSTDEWLRVTIAGHPYTIAVTDAQDVTVIDGVWYQYDTETGLAIVTGYDRINLPTNVVIPSDITVNGTAYSVHSIGSSAFYNCAALESVEFKSVVGWIGNSAFSNCTVLASVTFDSKVNNIGDNAFYNCAALESVEFKDTVGSIGNSAFYNCTALASVTFDAGVNSIDNNAFSNCAALENVEFKGTVGSIGNRHLQY